MKTSLFVAIGFMLIVVDQAVLAQDILKPVKTAIYNESSFFLSGIDHWATQTDGDGYVAMDFASAGSNPEIVKLLIENGANVNRSSFVWSKDLHYQGREHAWTPLFNAVAGCASYDKSHRKPAFQILKLLVDSGANVNLKSGSSYIDGFFSDELYPLIYLLREEISDPTTDQAIGYLLDHGANVNVKLYDRYAIHMAASNCNEKAAELLLKHGANVNARDGQGDTPLYLAKKQNCKKTVAILSKFGGVEE